MSSATPGGDVPGRVALPPSVAAAFPAPLSFFASSAAAARTAAFMAASAFEEAAVPPAEDAPAEEAHGGANTTSGTAGRWTEALDAVVTAAVAAS